MISVTMVKKLLNLPCLFCLTLALSPFVAMASDNLASDSDTSPITEFIIADGDTLWLTEPLEILGSRIPVALPGLVRSVHMLGSDKIDILPGRSAAELLQGIPSVIVSQRQQYGVQADVMVRGSTFEQVQVLLDGFDMGDPQTGHHQMDLPIGRQDISRIEVLPGHGSALYGSGAFGGTINVVTKKPSGANAGEFAFTGGGNNTWAARGNVETADAHSNVSSRFSIERFKTDGYDVAQDDGSQAWAGNDADVFSSTFQILHQGDDSESQIFAGYSKRNFGALDFYSPYPSTEATGTAYVAGRFNRKVSDSFSIEPRVFYRRHSDRFVLFRSNPNAYINNHLTRKIGSELRGIVDLNQNHILALSLEGVYEDIDSQGIRSGARTSALGSHLRRRGSFAAEIDRVSGKLTWQLGGRVDTRNSYAPNFSGSAAATLAVTNSLSVRSSIGSVYRIPTFTELYYVSPSNMGNTQLSPEKGWTWDVALDHQSGSWNTHLAYFDRHENDLIEWARPLGASVWQVTNIADGTVKGVELSGSHSFSRGHSLSAGYTWIEKETTMPVAYEGKYTLLTPKHQIFAQGRVVLPWHLALTVTGRYLEHTAGPDDFRNHFVLDQRLDWQNASNWFVSLVATNVLDRRYEEVPGIEMSGMLSTLTVGRKF